MLRRIGIGNAGMIFAVLICRALVSTDDLGARQHLQLVTP